MITNALAGEHLLPGNLGHFFATLSFSSSILAFISYFFASKNDGSSSWKTIGRIAFSINTACVILIGVCLFYIISQHYFEYHYAWAHSSTSLPTHYMISCYWEGQEGSFWLWSFWQSLIGLVLIWKAKAWENPVMTFVSLSQIFLSSMLLGVEILGQKIGSSPFILLRKAMDAPIFAKSDYLSFIQDGNGLNPLLQNYWMVIHPPTLFLGFAAMVVPSAYCMAGLWQQKRTEWMKPSLPWALFALLVLGGGIIMGAFWAYEALNFGGFWAWDPVENASLFPWVILIGAIHVIIVFQKTGQAYWSSVLLTITSFLLVLYATFLTRSGILGESSVHSFTDLGLSGQMLIYILAFVAVGAYLVFIDRKNAPKNEKEEAVYSREFWMFIGALIMVVSCLQIIGTTSLPVINKIFGSNLAPPVNVIKHYNKWQAPFAILITIMSGFSLHLKFQKTDAKRFLISCGVLASIALALSVPFVWITETYHNAIHAILVFACVFSILANASVLNTAFKGKKKISGAGITHIGFAMLIIGGLIAAATNKVVSVNLSGIGFGKEFDKNNNSSENILLYKGEPNRMAGYTVTYMGDSLAAPNSFYKILFQRFDDKNNLLKESFVLAPSAQINPKMGLIASPDTKHYLLHDIYTHVSMVPLKNNEEEHDHKNEDEKYLDAQKFEVSQGDSVHLGTKTIVVKSINKNPEIKNLPLKQGDLAVGLDLEVLVGDKSYSATPIFLIRGNNTFDFGKTVDEIGMKFNFTNVLPEKNKLELSVREMKPSERDYIVLKAIEFPYINLLWAGTIVMCGGFGISIYNRLKKRANVMS